MVGLPGGVAGVAGVDGPGADAEGAQGFHGAAVGACDLFFPGESVQSAIRGRVSLRTRGGGILFGGGALRCRFLLACPGRWGQVPRWTLLGFWVLRGFKGSGVMVDRRVVNGEDALGVIAKALRAGGCGESFGP